jgi:hypothetical protein
MTDAHYTFLPYVRRGSAASIPAPGDTPTNRARLPVDLDVTGGGLSVDLTLYGPGDATGIDVRQVVRTDPEPHTTEFEPNYFPTVEFDHPDFPWLLTPVGPTGSHLSPWLVLVVVREADATLGPGPVESLPVLEAPRAQLPDLSESWAWAHAQVVTEGAPPNVGARLAADDRRVTSRLVCPRRLDPETSYVACLVPAFDAGRRAGLGEAVPEGSLSPAWTGGPDADGSVRLPVYYHWEFGTGKAGDFEALVRRLTPVRFPPDIGGRDVDVTSLYDELGLDEEPTPGPETVRVEGAIRAAGREQPTTPEGPFKRALRDVVDAPAALEAAGDILADDVERSDEEREAAVREAVAARVDLRSRYADVLDEVVSAANTLSRRGNPLVVGPPLYGGFQSDERVVPPDGTRPKWLGELNLDPRYRAIGNYGTRVVRREQESLMASAWEQVDELRTVNAAFRRGQFARTLARELYERDVSRLTPESLFSFTGPMHPRVRGPGPETVRTLVASSALPGATFTGEFRRLARPDGPIGRAAAADLTPETLVAEMNDPASVVAPSTGRPDGVVTLGDVDAELDDREGFMENLVKRESFDDRIAPVVERGGPPIRDFDMAVEEGGLGRSDPALGTRSRRGLLGPDGPVVSGEVSGIGGGVPSLPTEVDRRTVSAVRDPAREFLETVRGNLARGEREPLEPLDTARVSTALRDRLDPAKTLRNRLFDRLDLSVGLEADEERVEQIMVAPTFPRPMYEPLKELSEELILPGVDRIPPDSVGVLNTNPEFIESYMVGLSHEMSRELLWREFPTDMRGTYFRRFWDKRGCVGATRTEDIDPVHRWDDDGVLGEAGLVPEARTDDLVLLVRGELFRRYPNTVVYAVPALRPGPDPGTGRPPLPDDPTGLDVLRARVPSPDPEAEKYPMFRGTLGTDTTFFGFDLDPEVARGTPFETRSARDEARNSGPEEVSLGWYLVLQQEPTKARFGLDAAEGAFGTDAGPVESWNDLTWGHLAGSEAELQAITHLRLSRTPATLPSTDDPAFEPDPAWNAGADASDVAGITFQRPFRVAIHADDMLPEDA